MHHRAIYEIQWSDERERWVVWRGNPGQIGGEAVDRDEAICLAKLFAEFYSPAIIRVRNRHGEIESIRYV